VKVNRRTAEDARLSLLYIRHTTFSVAKMRINNPENRIMDPPLFDLCYARSLCRDGSSFNALPNRLSLYVVQFTSRIDTQKTVCSSHRVCGGTSVTESAISLKYSERAGGEREREKTRLTGCNIRLKGNPW